jgi:DNA-binding SARP family transcriptional activator
MLRLRTLGDALVERQGGPARGAATQRKPLALLSLLAVAGERGLSRDRLLAYLWPEVGPERAPHCLNQVLYALRRDLDADALFLGSARIRLNPDLITSDVAEFSAARRAGDLERAVALYTGPFLDGFSVRGTPEFERWMEAERGAFGRAFEEALEGLAAQAMAAGDFRRAIAWWRRLGDNDPFSSRVTMHLMQALAASGKRAEALKAAHAYQQLMVEELDAAPSPAVLALADQLRQQPSPPTRAAAPSEAVAIAVLPLAQVGAEPSLPGFAAGLTEELMSALGRLEGVRVVARTSVEALSSAGLEVREIGRRLGARAILEGSVRQAGNRVRVTANLVTTLDGCRAASETHDMTLHDSFQGQEELARLIVAGMKPAIAELRLTEGPGSDDREPAPS